MPSVSGSLENPRRLVHEREMFRAVLGIAGADIVEAIRQARNEVLTWAQLRTGGPLPDDAWRGQSFEALRGGRLTMAAQVTGGRIGVWALRADDPDKSVAGRTWTTEATIGWDGTSLPKLSVRQIVSSNERDIQAAPAVPRFISDIGKNISIVVDNIKIRAGAIFIDDEIELGEIIALITDPKRRLPVIVLTGDERSDNPDRPLLDADRLARSTTGLAHVAVLPSRLTYVLTDAFGKARSAFHGAARIYMPGFDSSSNPYEHSLILSDILRADEESARSTLCWRVATESLMRTRLGQDVLSFAAVRSAAARAEQEERLSAGASETDQLAAAEQRIKALETELVSARSEADRTYELAAEEEERARTAAAQLHNAKLRIASLEEAMRLRGVTDLSLQTLPSNWGEFADWADRAFVGRLVLMPSARRGTKAPLFGDVELAGRCLDWLATECRDRRMNGGGTIANIPIGDGIENAPAGSDGFEIYFEGRTININWHLKSGGNTRDPARRLRIYYGLDELTQQIIVADMPAHRRSGAT